jgi:polyamine oxidase
VWLCGCVAVWLCGCVAVWLCGCVAVWLLAVGRDMNKVVLQYPVQFWPSVNWFTNILPAGQRPCGVSLSSPVSVAPNSNILVAWQFGTVARQRERLSDDELVAVVAEEIRHTFQASCDRPIPAPIAHAVTRWGTDVFSRGSYSFSGVGSDHQEDISVLGAPVDDKLFFAGEATDADYPGTVHGALLAGLREAKRVMDVFARAESTRPHTRQRLWTNKSE